MRTLGFILLLLGNFPTLGQAADPALKQLMHSLAQVESVTAHFQERKELAILEEPLITRGSLYYRAPDYLKKQTLEPYRDSFEVDGDWLVIDNPDTGKRHLSLQGYPALRAFVESFRATLAGDLNTLERYYQIQFQETQEDWKLWLKPKDPAMAKHIDTIVIHGQENQIQRLDIMETDGDRSLITITSDHG